MSVDHFTPTLYTSQLLNLLFGENIIQAIDMFQGREREQE
jgi:hypothetical protein